MMSVTMMGTIGSYTKTMKLQTQWNLKKQSGDLTSHKKSLDEWLQANTAKTSSENTSSANPLSAKQGGDSKLRLIEAKLDAGAKLTAKERAYLKEKDPEAYADLEANEQKQRAYEQQMKRCRTKEEVQRLKMAHVGTSLAKVNAVKNDPAISLEKKLKIAKQEMRLCNKLQESTQEFIRRGDYEKLPTDQELAKAEREEAEKNTQNTENTENTEPTAQDTKTSDDTDTEPEAPDNPQAKKPEKTATQAESPERRKARRAKAMAAYAYIKPREDIQNVAVPSLDQKA